MRRKWLAVGIILLFVGVSIAPTINYSIVKASTDNDLIEVTSQACGIQGYGNTTVRLTKQQYQDLEQYLAEFRARLNQTTTREEAVPLFKEAVMELNKYGLLPKGMSVERAQKLVTLQNQNKNIGRMQTIYLNNHLRSLNNSNFFCLTTGETNRTAVVGIIPTLLMSIGVVGMGFGAILSDHLYIPGIIIYYLFGYLAAFGILGYFFPATILSLITLGAEFLDYINGRIVYYPAYGWIKTFGVNLVKSWNGSFFGQFILPFVFLDTGIIGFTGIKIVHIDSCFYLGSALWVNIGHNPRVH
jgi:hypothetical protein